MILRKHSTERRGATLVESALVLGVALLMILGILEYARYLFTIHMAESAANYACRYAVTRTGENISTAQIAAKVDFMMSGYQGAINGYTVNVFPAQPNVYPPTPVGGAAWNDAPFGSYICVQVTGNYQFVASTLFNLPATIPVSVFATMNSEAN